MNFLALQNELLPAGVGLTARFKEPQRPSVKLWLNDRYAEVWGLEDWTFRKAAAPLTVIAGSPYATVPVDLAIVLNVWRDDGSPVEYVDPETYFRVHLGNISAAIPSRYTVVNKQILLDPTPGASSATWEIYYERSPWVSGNPLTGPPLVNDADVPALPLEHHYMLVHGAGATGQTLMQDFTYQFSEQRWQNQVQAMRRNYLADVRGDPRSSQWAASFWG